MLRLLASLTVMVLLSAVGCGADPAVSCQVNGDCASGVCRADKTCAATDPDAHDAVFVPPDALFPSDGTAPADSAIAGDTAAAGDTLAASDTTPADTIAADTAPPVDTVTPVGCVPNHDRVVTRAEFPDAVDQQLRLRVATEVTFDTRPSTGPGGGFRWNLAQVFEGEEDAVVATVDPATTWYGATFPTASYALRLPGPDELLGVYRVDDDGLYLLGVVSPGGDESPTELSYNPPARILAFPLQAGANWQTDSEVSGPLRGIWTFATENWHASVELDGTVTTPAGDFPVVRVIAGLYRWVGASFYYDVRHLFVAECEGAVAVVLGHGNDGGPELVTAAEVRRRAP